MPGDGLLDWLKSESIVGRITEVASKALDPVRFLRLCNMVVYKTPKLQECRRATILQSVIEASARGWEIGFDAHLVPYKTKTGMECQLIADYRGLKKSVMRGGNVIKMKAGVVFEGEDYIWEEGGLEERFEYTPKADITGKEKMMFAWARAWFKDGTAQFTIVRRFEVLRSMAASRGSGSEYSPWKKFPDRMWAKTALRRLCNEIGLSDEAMAVLRDDDARSYQFHPKDTEAMMAEPKVTVVDNEDSEDEAERSAADEEAKKLEADSGGEETNGAEAKPAPKKRTRKKKAAEKPPEETESGEGREADADEKGSKEPKEEPQGANAELVAQVIKGGKEWQLEKAALVSGAESIEQKVLKKGLADALPATLEKMIELLSSEEGAFTIEEHALSWQDQQASA